VSAVAAPPLRAAVAARSGDRVLLALAGVLVLGAALRVWQLDALGFNSDETVYLGQGAALAGVPELDPYFPLFRAHPLLFQSLLSFGFRIGLEGSFGRLLSAGIGLATILLVFETGRLLYGRRAGVLAALLLAVMPYHVLVTRQVLLDGPMTLCATLTLYLVARYAVTERAAWLYAAGAALGLTTLAKETGIVLLGAIYAFLALSPTIPLRARDALRSLAITGAVIAPYPLALALAGETGKGGNFLTWQLVRPPNHEWSFYATTVPAAVGPLVIAVALAGLWILRREGSWRETLLLAWIATPVAFFGVWPVKGYQYLLPAAPALALLAGRALAYVGERTPRAQATATAVVVVSLLVPVWQDIQPSRSATSLAGTGGVAGGREAGRWVREHVPRGATLLTIGPSMANVLQFYGHRKAYGLSVSLNPLRRNPTYTPLRNPDRSIRRGELQYVVWDAFSAERSPGFARRLLRYADRYHGRVIASESVPVTTRAGARASTPVVVIYEVHP
jgi:Dolichyl-phosphate-mannose-protein mannosyltransferase